MLGAMARSSTILVPVYPVAAAGNHTPSSTLAASGASGFVLCPWKERV